MSYPVYEIMGKITPPKNIRSIKDVIAMKTYYIKDFDTTFSFLLIKIPEVGFLNIHFSLGHDFRMRFILYPFA